MDGIFGWLGDQGAHQDLIKQMGQAARLSPDSPLQAHSTQQLGVAGASRFGKAAIHVENGLAAALYGRPRFIDEELASIARDQSPVVAVAQGWLRHGEKLPTLMHGNFAFAVLEPAKKQAFLALDRVGAERLCYAHRDGQLVFGSSVQSVAAHPAVGRNIDPQAIYDYLYFHTIPAPRSLYQGVHKLLPGQYAVLKNGQLTTGFYWQADYTPVDAGYDTHRRQFRSILDQSVRDIDAPGTAAFLSGGTDSSTVVGALTAARGTPVDTFSIGFDAQGFDEMEYARCAAERYKCNSHEYYLKPADIVTAIPIIAHEYDEPFGQQLGGADLLLRPGGT
jgi:asparagine synthase (glutamine-hydrolysing)